MGEIIPIPVQNNQFPVFFKLVLESLDHMSIMLSKNFFDLRCGNGEIIPFPVSKIFS